MSRSIEDANPAYWGGSPKIDGIRFVIVPSGDTAVSMYDAGELDFVVVPENAYRRVLDDPRYGAELIKVPKAQINYLGMNQALYAPFRDARVREAISLVINRDAMISGLYNGAAVPLNGQVTPGVAGYSNDLPPLAYDPDRARKLLADAGFPDGKGLPPLADHQHRAQQGPDHISCQSVQQASWACRLRSTSSSGRPTSRR